MFQLLITTLEQRKGAPKVADVRHPVATTVASFMSEEAREAAIAKLDKFNFDRKHEDVVNIIGNISYLYVRL